MGPAATDQAHSPAIVLCCSGHDPSGGAGIHADIESCAANGARAVTLITALTVQDSRNVRRVQAVAPLILADAADTLIADITPQAVKVGLVGDPQQLPVLKALLTRLMLPLVLDPILRAGGGAQLLSRPLAALLKEELFGLVTVLTPNAAEARQLTGCERLPDAADRLLKLGVEHVLITGGDEPEAEAVDWHFQQGAEPRRHAWPRLPQSFHGAGCTLASAIAAQLARGEPVARAIELAQAYTHRALRQAQAVGGGRLLPGRWP